jgi:DNA (cytosine-5)-methyltransferase 1
MRVGSDFSGVGAFEQALKRLKVDYKTIFACDLDKYARQTYLENNGEPGYFPNDVYDRDIPAEPLTIYMSSPPCQSFSLAGSRKGEQDDRGVLFYNSHEFIKVNKPRYFIFENVKGLLSDDNGKTFQRWIDYLATSVNGQPVIFPHEESVMYHVYHKVLNSKDFGVPQNRERIFIIGIRDDKDNYFRFPKEEYLTKKLKDVLENEVDDKYYLSESAINGIKNSTYESKQNIIQNKDYADTILSRDYKDPKCIKTENSQAIEMKQSKIRRLTPRECFRLQDFPDSFTWTCSDTQAYRQAGNSITVGVLEKLLNKLINVNNF